MLFLFVSLATNLILITFSSTFELKMQWTGNRQPASYKMIARPNVDRGVQKFTAFSINLGTQLIGSG